MQAGAPPLRGLVVVALEQAVAAPYCSMRMADAGARVIKIERAEGDFARGYDQAAAGSSSYFVWLNRGKQSLVADIKNPDDAALLQRIVAGADVFIQNLAPGAAARAGFGATTLRAGNTRLITLDISGYGEASDYADMKAYDLLVQAESGLASITGHPAGPGRVGVSVCDIACGLTAYSAVLEALIARGISGEGRALSVSLFDSIADWMNVPLLYFEGTGIAPPRVGLAHPSICPYGAFALADASMVLIAIQNDREWADFCGAVLRLPELSGHPDFATNAGRVANRVAVDGIVGKVLSGLARVSAVGRLRAARTAFGFVNDMAGLAAHPALRRTEVATQGGAVRVIAPPVGYGDLGPVPGIGQHSATIRREFG
jgi:crotonobetainyl-CoA:carnitine CoA-transferase CaiB-like acyl-CoA transferase